MLLHGTILSNSASVLIDVFISLEEKKLALFLLLDLERFVRCSGLGRAEARGFETLIR